MLVYADLCWMSVCKPAKYIFCKCEVTWPKIGVLNNSLNVLVWTEECIRHSFWWIVQTVHLCFARLLQWFRKKTTFPCWYMVIQHQKFWANEVHLPKKKEANKFSKHARWIKLKYGCEQVIHATMLRGKYSTNVR